ncbi:MAG: hypothetical protein CG442_971, partial [Methylococcaceae bacterium NSO1]
VDLRNNKLEVPTRRALQAMGYINHQVLKGMS